MAAMGRMQDYYMRILTNQCVLFYKVLSFIACAQPAKCKVK